MSEAQQAGRYARLNPEGRVVNIELAAPDFAARENLVPEGPGCEIGAVYDPQARTFSAHSDLDGYRAAKSAAVNACRDQLFGLGYSHNFGGSAGVRRLDLRSADDKANWLVAQNEIRDLLDDDQPTAPYFMRSADNVTFQTTAQTAWVALEGLRDWGKAIMGTAWTLKDVIKLAADQAALDAIDIEAAFEAALS